MKNILILLLFISFPIFSFAENNSIIVPAQSDLAHISKSMSQTISKNLQYLLGKAPEPIITAEYENEMHNIMWKVYFSNREVINNYGGFSPYYLSDAYDLVRSIRATLRYRGFERMLYPHLQRFLLLLHLHSLMDSADETHSNIANSMLPILAYSLIDIHKEVRISVHNALTRFKMFSEMYAIIADADPNMKHSLIKIGEWFASAEDYQLTTIKQAMENETQSKARQAINRNTLFTASIWGGSSAAVTSMIMIPVGLVSGHLGISAATIFLPSVILAATSAFPKYISLKIKDMTFPSSLKAEFAYESTLACNQMILGLKENTNQQKNKFHFKE